MATIYYASINDLHTVSKDVDHSGTSSTAGDVLEIRMGNGTFAPTRFDVLVGLGRLTRWVMQGGLDGAGANLPKPT